MLSKQVLPPLERPPTVALMAVSYRAGISITAYAQFNQKTRPRGHI